MSDSIGVVLAGGTGSRLFPITSSTNKHLLPVYSKPLIYYPLTTLMLAGNREIVLITNPNDIEKFKSLLGDGSMYGISITFVEQEKPKGLAHALYQAKEFTHGKNINLILGDNIFYGKGLKEFLLEAKSNSQNCLFTQDVKDPGAFGVLIREKNNSLKIIEKPKNPKSSEAVLGLYFYEKDIFDLIESLKPSTRGELEITSLNNKLLSNKSVLVKNIGRGTSWYDAGTVEDLFEAGNFIQSIENRQEVLIGSLEEVAYNSGWISEKEFEEMVLKIRDSKYGKSLFKKYFDT